jgi:hypothetical protein
MAFLDNALARYRLERDLPTVDATSRLSPHLAFGEISARQIWRAATTRGRSAATEKFLTELGWREYAYHLLFHHADLAERQARQKAENDLKAPALVVRTSHGSNRRLAFTLSATTPRRLKACFRRASRSRTPRS